MVTSTYMTLTDERWLSPLPLWTGILAGPIAWAIDLEVSYALVHWICGTQQVLVLHLVSAMALLITAAGAAISWRALQQATHAATTDRGERARASFMALLGLASAVLFSLAIVAGAIPSWILAACQ